MGRETTDLILRPQGPDDDPAVLALLQASLGWVPDDQYASFFDWKHRANPFGESKAWVAVDGERVVGFRTFLRWEFVQDGTVRRAVRAVDTATHPDHQGRGIFRRLTLRAVDEMAAEGVDFVFNTPNDQSRPGYLKMGWQPVRRLPVLARPRMPWSLVRLARARVPADKWSQPTTAGHPASDVLADTDGVEQLLRSLAPQPPGTLTTRRTAAFLAWRYGFAPLAYRAVLADEQAGVAGGLALFRLRRRGAALEAAVGDVLVPGDDRQVAARLVGEVVRRSRADVALRLGGGGAVRARSVPVPGQGPTLVWRSVCATEVPPAAAWRVTLGDIELF